MVLVRAATVGDAAGIAHVHVASWRTTYAGIVPEDYLAGLDEAERAGQWRGWLAPNDRGLVKVFVAEVDGAIVGFVAGGGLREGLESHPELDAELFAIYLLQRVQGLGIGSRLLQALMESLTREGFKGMVAWVLEGNTSRGFYERTGGVPVASKEMEIGGAMLPVTAYGWARLEEESA